MALKTDYKDYIPPSGGRKYKITANSDGSSSVEDITQYQQVGDTWGAEDINQVNKLVNGAVYPNLLDNSDFTDPVNQRGKTSYTAEAAAYAIDRWAILYGTFDVSARQLTGTTYTGRTCCIRQALSEAEKGLAVGSMIAFSAQINGQIHKSGMTVQDRSQYGEFSEVPAGYICKDFEVVCYSIYGTVYLSIYAKKALVLDWMKVEKGSVVTPYVPNGYGAELLECMRYFYSTVGVWTRIVTQAQYNGALQLMGFFPVPMRTVPTITFDGTYQKNVSGATSNPFSNIGFNELTPIGYSGYIATGEASVNFLLKYNYTASADL